MDSIEFANRAVSVPFVDKGRDWNGWDCWGLAYCYYPSVWGVEVPLHLTGYANTRDLDRIKQLLAEGVTEDRWIHIADNNIEAKAVIAMHQERVGDGFLLRMRNRPIHVAIVVEPGMMLHAEEGVGTTKVEYNNFKWEKRIIGIYRNREVANAV